MVVLLDLDEDVLSPHADPRDPARPSQSFNRARAIALSVDQVSSLNNSSFTASLACYPYASRCHLQIVPRKLMSIPVQCCFPTDKVA